MKDEAGKEKAMEREKRTAERVKGREEKKVSVVRWGGVVFEVFRSILFCFVSFRFVLLCFALLCSFVV